MKNFFILSCARSGTTLLTKTLNTHPEIACFGEEFNQSSIRKSNFQEKFKYVFDNKNLVNGCKIFYDHLTIDRWNFIKEQNFKCIHLIRKNILRTYTSLEICKHGNAWIQEHKKVKPLKNRKVHINLDDFINYQITFNIQRKYFTQFFSSSEYLEIYYEDLINNFDKTIKQIQKFLNVKYQKLHPQTFRQNPEPLKDLIINYDEVMNYKY